MFLVIIKYSLFINIVYNLNHMRTKNITLGVTCGFLVNLVPYCNANKYKIQVTFIHVLKAENISVKYSILV